MLVGLGAVAGVLVGDAILNTLASVKAKVLTLAITILHLVLTV